MQYVLEYSRAGLNNHLGYIIDTLYDRNWIVLSPEVSQNVITCLEERPERIDGLHKCIMWGGGGLEVKANKSPRIAASLEATVTCGITDTRDDEATTIFPKAANKFLLM